MSQLFSGKDTCFAANGKLSTHWKHAKGMSLRYGVIVFGNLMRLFTKKSFYSQECSAELGGGRGWR